LVATHYYALFFLAGETLVIVVLRPRPAAAWRLAVLATWAFALGSVCVAATVARHDAGGEYDMSLFAPLALPGSLWAMLSGFVRLPSSAELHSHPARAVLTYAPLAVAAVAPFCFCAVTGMRALGWRAWTIVGTTLLATCAGPFAMYLCFDVGM